MRCPWIVPTVRPRPSFDPAIADEAPAAPTLTDYDFTLFVCYLRLLDAEAAQADWRDVARIVLNIDPDRDYARAKRMYDSHLRRAQWMTETGYRLLLLEDDNGR